MPSRRTIRGRNTRRAKVEQLAADLGGLIVTHDGEMFVVVAVGARIVVIDEQRRQYATGVWRGGYADWESEPHVKWRLIDRVDLALRRQFRALRGGQPKTETQKELLATISRSRIIERSRSGNQRKRGSMGRSKKK